jgi:hypothetical protein
MPIPGLTDIYAFGDWMKRDYHGAARKPLLIEPIAGGLINVTEQPGTEASCTAEWRKNNVPTVEAVSC